MANTDATFDIILILLVTVLAVIVKLIIKLISCFNKKTAYIVRRMRCCSYDEYRHWRRELRCHYLCLIPFVTKRNVAKVYHHLFYKPKYMKKKEPRTDGFYHVIAPSLLSICLCAICLCGVSWAWFTSSQSSSITQIQSARYTINVTTQVGSTTTTKGADEKGNYNFTFDAGSTYTVKITPTGTASTGYCVVGIKDTTYYTPQIEKDKSFEFTVIANEAVDIAITPQWGSCSNTSNIISAGYTFTVGTLQEIMTEEQPENNVTADPPASDDKNADNDAGTVAPTVPTEETTTPATDTTEQTNSPETTEETQPAEEPDASEQEKPDSENSAADCDETNE